MNSSRGLAMPVLACLFAALISVGAYIALPLPGTPIPVVLQNFFIMLAALLLGPAWALASVLVYLLLGAMGLPVFSGGTGGFARFLGPTGGYLVGYVPAVLAMGAISRMGARRRWWRDGLALVAGCALVYACGLPWLKIALKGSWEKAIAGGLVPFLPGDAVKIALACFIAGRIAPLVDRFAPRRGGAEAKAAQDRG